MTTTSLDRARRLLERTRRLIHSAHDHADGHIDSALLLQVAHHLDEMVGLLAPDDSLGQRSDVCAERTIGEAVAATLESLKSLASEHSITLRSRVDAALDDTPVGILDIIIEPALQDALLACAVDGLDARTVDFSASIECGPVFRDVCICIEDSGTRSDNDDRTRTLDRARSLLQSHGGDLLRSNVPFSGGSVLQVRIPLSVLTNIVSDSIPPLDEVSAA